MLPRTRWMVVINCPRTYRTVSLFKPQGLNCNTVSVVTQYRLPPARFSVQDSTLVSVTYDNRFRGRSLRPMQLSHLRLLHSLTPPFAPSDPVCSPSNPFRHLQFLLSGCVLPTLSYLAWPFACFLRRCCFKSHILCSSRVYPPSDSFLDLTCRIAFPLMLVSLSRGIPSCISLSQ